MSRAAAIVLVGALLIVVAFAFDTSQLFVPGIAFALVGLIVPPWMLLASRSTSVTRAFEAEEVLEDQALQAMIQVRGGPLGVPGGEIRDPLAGESIPLTRFLFAPRGRRTAEVRVVVRFHRRGRRTLPAPVLSLRDPLGIFPVVRPGTDDAQTLLVLPRLDRVRLSRDELDRRLEHQPGPPLLESLAAVEVDGLRPYRPGTPASRISWPALARGAGLLERRMQAERDSGPLVVLDVRSPDATGRVDAAVRAAASLTHELARHTGCELLLPGDRRPTQIDPDLAGWPNVHVRLALVEGGPDAPAPIFTTHARNGMVLYVAAHCEQLPPQLTRGAHRGVVLVLPLDVAPPVRQPPRFEVSGCAGYVLVGGARLRRPRERAA